MECFKLLESLDALGYAGTCVGTEQSQLLKNSLLILQQENRFRKCYYWGRVCGAQNDYHIAYGYRDDSMTEQVYYYSIDCMNWLLMPKASKCARFLTPLAINKFEGDPSIVVNVYKPNPPFPPNEDPRKYYDVRHTVRQKKECIAPTAQRGAGGSGIDRSRHLVYQILACHWLSWPTQPMSGRFRFPPHPAELWERCIHYFGVLYGPMPKELKEEDRLAATVDLIKEDAVVVPRGAWFKRADGDVVESLSFDGLCLSEARNLKSYLHGRSPQRKWNANLLTRPDYNYAIDFLDPIDLDVPHGCWSLQLLPGNRLALLHSLYWPGMTFYHKLNSPHHGFLYVGHGKKNMDVPFMV